MRILLLPGTLAAALALSACSGNNVASLVPQSGTSATASATQLRTTSSIATSAARVLRSPLGATSVLPAGAGAASKKSLCAEKKDAAHARCFSSVLIASTNPGTVYGLTPNDLSILYNYKSPGKQGSAGVGQTVAVVVAGDYSQAEADLAVYRKYFGLPPCTTANGCLGKVRASPAGGSSPLGDASSISAFATSISAFATTANAKGWAAETDADIEVVSAVCPNCKIMIAEAASDSIADLSSAVSAAVNAKASIVNASFGAPEVAADLQYASAYSNGRVKVVAAAGDWGYGVYFPASDNDVIAVGGTSLTVNGSAVSETVWSDSGSGCSGLFPLMEWQHVSSFSDPCRKRNVADVAAAADPNTGFAVYDSTIDGASGGWSMFGGTSIAAPIITGMYALSGDDASGEGAERIYAGYASFLPVTSGSNGNCTPAYLCSATRTYSGPAGLGVPNGLGGF